MGQGSSADTRAAVARAIAFFEQCDDVPYMRQALADVAPKARRLVGAHMRRGGGVPDPASVPPAPIPADEREALATLRAVEDFALFQALTRAIGQRVEALTDED